MFLFDTFVCATRKLFNTFDPDNTLSLTRLPYSTIYYIAGNNVLRILELICMCILCIYRTVSAWESKIYMFLELL